MFWLDRGGAGPALFLVFMIVITVLFMRSINKVSARSGCVSPTMLRYNKRMMWSSIAYMVGLMGAVSLYNEVALSRPLLAVVALVPAGAVLAMVWAMGRLLLEEDDEYLRYRIVKQALFATGGLLAVSTVWGFLEMFGLVVHVPAWATVPLFAIMLGVGQCFRWVRS